MSDEPTRVCGVPDQAGAGQVCKWPDGNVKICATSIPPPMDINQWNQAAQWVCDQVNGVCGANLSITEVAGQARILCASVRLDGPNGVLADSEMPCSPSVRVCRQRYDNGENWTLSLPPEPGRIPFKLTKLHECLHAMGVPHAPDGVVAVMAAFLNSKLIGLMTWDIEQLVLRYGPAKPKPVPPPVPTPGVKSRIVLEIDGAITGVRIVSVGQPETMPAPPAPVPLPVPTPSPVPVPNPGGFSMSRVIALLRGFLPLARIVATQTPNKVDDAVIDLIDSILDSLPADQAAALAKVAELKARLTA